MESDHKRKLDDDASSRPEKKRKKQWRVPRHGGKVAPTSRSIQPGDSGIWATCDKGRESKCIGELRDLFSEYAEALYGDAAAGSDPHNTAADGGIENDIQAEINDLQQPEKIQLFTPLRVDVQCVVFIKTQPPVDPVEFVKKICQDAVNNPRQKRTRFVKRLTPMALMGRASEDGLEKVAKTVLGPHFHQEPFRPRKFAIRPNLRNHNTLSRDSVIRQVAKIIGSGHEVNLKSYDLLVIVEVYQTICGIAVVDTSFDQMKRYSLSEIYSPTPKDESFDPAADLAPARL